MSSIQTKITRHSNIQENMTHNEKKSIIKTYLEKIHMIEALNKYIKTVITVSHRFRNAEEKLSILGRDLEDT